jgi:hypothetical protein
VSFFKIGGRGVGCHFAKLKGRLLEFYFLLFIFLEHV